MNRFTRRCLALSAAAVLTLAITSSPADAAVYSRKAAAAGSGTFPGYSIGSGGWFLYEGAATSTTTAGGYATFEVSCAVQLGGIGQYPYLSNIWATCWLEDLSTGTDHYVNQTVVWPSPNYYDARHETMTLPTSREYRFCVRAHAWSQANGLRPVSAADCRPLT